MPSRLPFDNMFVERLRRSVKHEDVYLKGYSAAGELLLGLTQYFSFYNVERPHQGLQNRTPDKVYQSACGGGAMILDKYGAAVDVGHEPDHPRQHLPVDLRPCRFSHLACLQFTKPCVQLLV